MVQWFWIGDQETSDEDEILQEIPDDQEVWQIALDIIDSDQHLIIIAPVAGIELDNIDVSLDAATLTISGLRKKPDIFYQADDMNIKVSECFWGRFTRSVLLPENLDFDSVTASMENSLLIVRIAKLQFLSKKIKIEHLDD